jgi:hypothetical protein
VTVSVPGRLVKQFFQFDLVARLRQKIRKLQPKYEEEFGETFKDYVPVSDVMNKLAASFREMVI